MIPNVYAGTDGFTGLHPWTHPPALPPGLGRVRLACKVVNFRALEEHPGLLPQAHHLHQIKTQTR
jgi:hypothetical protein